MLALVELNHNRSRNELMEEEGTKKCIGAAWAYWSGGRIETLHHKAAQHHESGRNTL